MDNIVVFGSGGHAKVVIDVIEKNGNFSIIGLVDKYKSKGDNVYGYQIIGAEEDLIGIADKVYGGIIAIGDNWIRSQVVLYIRHSLPDFKFITEIHPFTTVAKGVKIGDGTVVMAGAIINADSTIGNHCIINTRASIDHDNSIGDFVSIAPNASTGGDVKIGDYSAISSGANIIHGIRIGEHTVIGAGSTVVKDIPSCVVAYGTPARVIRKRQPGDKYL